MISDQQQGTEYRQAVSQLMADYFSRFPEDAPRLSALTEQIADEQSDLCNRKTLPGHLTGSALVLNEETMCVLLIHHNALQRWLQPGGHLERNEHPAAGARRELEEEVGMLPVELDRWHKEHAVPLDIDSHIIPASKKKQEPQHLHHDYLYLFSWTAGKCSTDSEFALQAEEVSAHKWVSIDDLSTGQYGSRLRRAAQKIKLQFRDLGL